MQTWGVQWLSKCPKHVPRFNWRQTNCATVNILSIKMFCWLFHAKCSEIVPPHKERGRP